MRRRRAAALLVLAGTLLGLLVLVADPASSAGGTLDTSFGTAGAARIDLGGTGSFDAVTDLALQSDGKVLAVGTTATGFAVARLTATGVLDSTFGSGGTVVGSSMAAKGVAVQSDGKVLVVGQSAPTSGSLVLTRWSTAGVLDSTFGTGGTVTVAMAGADSGGHDVAVASDGKIVVLAVDAGVMTVLRYTSVGVADTTFATGGRANQTATPSLTSRVAVQPDGKVLLTGLVGTAGGVVRLTAAGVADAAFATTGTATSPNHVPRAVAVAVAGGKVVVAGDFGSADTKVMVTRRNADGTLDTSFATTGVAAFAVPGLARASARSLVVQADGSVVVAGRRDDSTRASPVFVARLTPAGILDAAFATAGIATFTTVSSLSTSSATGVLVDGSGRYLVGGSIVNDHGSFTNDNDFLVLRVTGPVTTTSSTSTTQPQAVTAGGTVSSDPGASPTATNKLVVSVTTPAAGTISIAKSNGTAAPGSRVLGGATISAPTASAAAPLQLEFGLDVSTLPDSLPLRSIVVTRDTAVASDCTSATAAAPDPCVASRSRSGDTVSIVVLSTHASAWTLSRPIVQRIFGDDRILSSIAVSKESFGNGKAASVVLSRSDDFADALAAIPLAVAKKGPLLLTGRQTLDDRVLAEVTRVLPVGKVVYVLGGPNALSEDVVDRLVNWGYDVVRLGGDTRYETAVIVATDGLGSPSIAIETTGLSFADALAAGAAAANVGGAVLLTAGSKQVEVTAAYVANASVRVAIGGPAAAADPDADAIVGDDRYETAVLTAKTFFEDEVATIGVASGTTFADALAGGVHAANLGGPLLLLPPKGALPVVVTIYLRDQKAPPSAYLYGGTSALGADVASALLKALGG